MLHEEAIVPQQHQTSFFQTMTQHNVFQMAQKLQLIINDKEKHKENPHVLENVWLKRDI